MKTVFGKTCAALGAVLMLAQGAGAQAQTQTQTKPYQTQSAETPATQVSSQDQAYQDAYNRGRADQAKDDQALSDRDRQSNSDQARGDAPPPQPGRDGRQYDGYCYQRKDQAAAGGAVVGALAGAAIGNAASDRRDRGGTTVAGAIIGAVLGSKVGGSSVECYDGRYYAYDSGYYAPPPPPEGYVTVFYYDRPARGYYRRIEHGYYRHW